MVDEQRLNAFLGKAVGDLGAAVSAVLVSIGDELGFYKTLANGALTGRRSAWRIPMGPPMCPGRIKS